MTQSAILSLVTRAYIAVVVVEVAVLAALWILSQHFAGAL